MLPYSAVYSLGMAGYCGSWRSLPTFSTCLLQVELMCKGYDLACFLIQRYAAWAWRGMAAVGTHLLNLYITSGVHVQGV